MAHSIWVVAVGLTLATSPLAAANLGPTTAGPAPTDSADARYCLRVEPVTGSLVETVRCWTRAQWVDQGVNVDKEWAREGVAILQ